MIEPIILELLKKLDLYKKHNIDKENYYLNEREHEKGKSIQRDYWYYKLWKQK